MNQQQSEMPAGFIQQPDNVAFTRVSWIFTNSNNGVLFLKYKKREKLFEPGCRSLPGLSCEETLAQKILRDLKVRLIPETIKQMFSFRAPAWGMTKETIMEVRCFRGEFEGKLHPTERIEALEWFYNVSRDRRRTTVAGATYIRALERQGLTWPSDE